MLVRNSYFIATLLFLCLCSSDGRADNMPPDQSPIAVLTATLATMNLSNPIADLEANTAKGDRRFIGINGYTCHAPGVGTKDDKFVTSSLYGIRCLEGTGDVIEGNQHKHLIDKAIEYARTYNGELLRRIHAGLVKSN